MAVANHSLIEVDSNVSDKPSVALLRHTALPAVKAHWLVEAG